MTKLNTGLPKFAVSTLADETAALDKLTDALTKVAKAKKLLVITSGQSVTKDSGVKVKVEIVGYADETSKTGTSVTFGTSGRRLRNGDVISFRISNTNPFPIDVTLLFLDSHYGITPLFPDPETVDDNRLFPGKSIETPRLTVTTDTVGPEQVVALAVRSTLTRQDFSCLSQKSLGVTRGNAAMDSPLGQLLKSAMFGDGKVRGLKKNKVTEFGALVIPWVTSP